MKYLKRFENINEIEAGDYVKCVDDSFMLNIENGNIYIVYRVVDFKYFLKIPNKHHNVLYSYTKDRFIPATPEEIEKYKIEQSANNYNL